MMDDPARQFIDLHQRVGRAGYMIDGMAHFSGAGLYEGSGENGFSCPQIAGQGDHITDRKPVRKIGRKCLCFCGIGQNNAASRYTSLMVRHIIDL